MIRIIIIVATTIAVSGCDFAKSFPLVLKGWLKSPVQTAEQDKWGAFKYDTTNDKGKTRSTDSEIIVHDALMNSSLSAKDKVVVGVSWQVKNTDKAPGEFGWKNKYLKNGEGYLFAPMSGTDSEELAPLTTSGLLYVFYQVPITATSTKNLYWGLLNDDESDLKYQVKLGFEGNEAFKNEVLNFAQADKITVDDDVIEFMRVYFDVFHEDRAKAH